MGDTVIVETPVDEVVSIVTQGPQGPSGSEAATLTTTGDLLYRDALANDRLPIGSEGQVLKVASGLPAWGNESGAVTSVNGETGTVVLGAADVGAATAAQGSLADSAVQPGDLATVATTGDYDDLNNKPASFTPSAHASTHHTGGSDAIAPSDIGAQYAFVTSGANLTADTTLSSGRTQKIFLNNYSSPATKITVTLPTTGNENGDILVLEGSTLADDIDIKNNPTGSIVATISASGQTFRFIYAGSWEIDRVYNHASQHVSGGLDPLSLAASQITSGTLAHERGGLEADVSAYDGLVKISGGSTSAVTVTTAGEALLDDADAAAQRTTLGLGAVASSNSYTDLDNQPSIPSALNDLSNVSAAAPSDNDVLVFDNATSTWVAEAPAGGATTQTDIFTANGTWTKPAGAKYCDVELVGGGGGGGGGRRGATSTDRGGGGGGGGGGRVFLRLRAADLGSTESVTVGAGGTGGATAADDTDGGTGADGGDTSFSVLTALGGAGGAGGNASAVATRGIGKASGTFVGTDGDATTDGGNGGFGATVPVLGESSTFAPAGGGGGARITTANNTNGSSGAGGAVSYGSGGVFTHIVAGGAAVLSFQSGSNAGASFGHIGTGGSGGRFNNTGWVPAAGGNGGLYGGGGGGGSGGLNASGGSTAGGTGGAGIVVITTYF